MKHHQVVALTFNPARNRRIAVFQRSEQAYSYRIEWLMDLSNEPVDPTLEIWCEIESAQSGIYDSVEKAVHEATRDHAWLFDRH